MFEVGERYRVRYQGSDGNFTERIIKVVRVDGSSGYIRAYCETRNSLRTFVAWRLDILEHLPAIGETMVGRYVGKWNEERIIFV